jgi:phosphoribosylformylglycinamidine synthase subunit PurL
MGTPVTGGNVSFYNQTGEVAIHPTPVIGVLGVIQDVDRRTPMAWQRDGEIVYVLGTTRDELAGSEWAHAIHNHLGGLPPVLDLNAEMTLAEILVAGSMKVCLQPPTMFLKVALRRRLLKWRCDLALVFD